MNSKCSASTCSCEEDDLDADEESGMIHLWPASFCGTKFVNGFVGDLVAVLHNHRG